MTLILVNPNPASRPTQSTANLPIRIELYCASLQTGLATGGGRVF